jgi:hypothetical protein
MPRVFRPESEGKLNEEPESINSSISHINDPFPRPREAGLAGRINDVKRFKGDPSLRQGLCPSCLGSGYVHGEREGRVGVLYRTVGKDRDGRDIDRLLRCSCPLGAAKSGDYEVRQAIQSVEEY